MQLTPREKDKLLLFTAALVAEQRLARGVKLNYPEAVALISNAIVEGARRILSHASLAIHDHYQRLLRVGVELTDPLPRPAKISPRTLCATGM